MQYLDIDRNTKLTDLNNIVGSRNVDAILHLNDLGRVPDIGKEYTTMCGNVIINSVDPIDWQRKYTVINKFASDYDLFQDAASLGDAGWVLLSKIDTFPNRLKIPETIKLPLTSNVHGDGRGVPSEIYNKALSQLADDQTNHTIDPSIFNEYSTRTPSAFDTHPNVDSFEWFPIPWGDVTLYSSLADDYVEFPVYPESVSDISKAEYITMPDIIYQYEPWQLYSSSGPRSNTYVFTFHRDMWTGDHRDGQANKLIRFCQANCYARYTGSAVHTALVTLYIKGVAHIRGILTQVDIDWSGPILQDGWYGLCKLSLSIIEVSAEKLDFDTMMKKGLIG